MGLFSNELKEFRGEMTKQGRTKFEAEEGEHDDLVMTVAQAVWYGELPHWSPSEWMPDDKPVVGCSSYDGLLI